MRSAWWPCSFTVLLLAGLGCDASSERDETYPPPVDGGGSLADLEALAEPGEADTGSPPPSDAGSATDGGSERADEGSGDDGGISADDQGGPHDDLGVPAADQGGAPATDGGGERDSGHVPAEVPDPWQDGPLAVEERMEQMDVPSRSFAFPVKLYLPVADGAVGAPLVILCHGFQLGAVGYASYGHRLASHGVATALPDYGDGIFAPHEHSELAASLSDLIDWLEQRSAPGGPLAGRVDPGRISAGGHSRGGKQAILAAIRDARILATFGLDPVDVCHPLRGCSEAYPSVTPELMDELTVPGAYFGSGHGAEAPLGQACAPANDNYHEYFGLAPSPSWEYLLPAAGHFDFVEDCGLLCFTCTSGEDPPWSRAFAVATLVAFHQVVLNRDERYRPWLDGAELLRHGERVQLLQR